MPADNFIAINLDNCGPMLLNCFAKILFGCVAQQ
jgi:hypothetical protein